MLDQEVDLGLGWVRSMALRYLLCCVYEGQGQKYGMLFYLLDFLAPGSAGQLRDHERFRV